jgi:hypothetical protein
MKVSDAQVTIEPDPRALASVAVIDTPGGSEPAWRGSLASTPPPPVTTETSLAQSTAPARPPVPSAAPIPTYSPAAWPPADQSVGQWASPDGAAPLALGRSFAQRWFSGWTPVFVLAPLVAVLLVVALVLPGSHSGPSLKGMAPQQALQTSLAAANVAQTFHMVANSSGAAQSQTIVGDIAPQGGSVTVTIGGHPMSIVSLGQTEYFKMDAASLLTFSGSPKAAQQFAGRWLSLPSSETGSLSRLAETLTTSAIVNDLLNVTGPISEVSSTRDALTLTGTISDAQINQGGGAGDRATLVISTHRPFLPLSISFSDAQSGSMHFDFSDWAQKVAIVAPPSPLSLAGFDNADGGRVAQENDRNALTAEFAYWTNNQAYDTTASPTGVQQLEPALHFVASGQVTPGTAVLLGADHDAVVITSAGSDGNCYSIEEITMPDGPIPMGTYFYEASGAGRGDQTSCGAPRTLVEALPAKPANSSASASPGVWSLSF